MNADQPKTVAALPVVGRLAATISTYEAAKSIVVQARNWYRTRQEFVTSVDSRDDAYQAVLAAVLERLPPTGRRSIEMITGRNDSPVVAVGEPRRAAVRWVYDGVRSTTLTIDGHPIRVEMTDAEKYSRGDWEYQRRSVRFVAQSTAGRDALHRWLTGIAETTVNATPTMRIASKWGSWDHRGDIPLRPIDTVILPGDTKDRIVADLEAFYASEADYVRLGCPYHRNLLLHGDPGSGKSSLAKALASHFRLNLYYLPLSDLTADAELLRLVSEVPARSMLLIEDIDVATAATERTDETRHATLSGLLNALDGVFTPHGLVTVMTTNHRDRLDDALTRPGRIDLEAEFGPVTREQAERLWTMATGRPPGDVSQFVGRPAAEVIEALRATIVAEAQP